MATQTETQVTKYDDGDITVLPCGVPMHSPQSDGPFRLLCDPGYYKIMVLHATGPLTRCPLVIAEDV
jgi:hypothetical protein